MDLTNTHTNRSEILDRIITILNEFCENRALLLEQHIYEPLVNWLTDWADDCDAADTTSAKQTLFAQFTDDAANRLHQHRINTKGWNAAAFTRPDTELHPKRRDELSRITTRIGRFGMTLLPA